MKLPSKAMRLNCCIVEYEGAVTSIPSAVVMQRSSLQFSQNTAPFEFIVVSKANGQLATMNYDHCYLGVHGLIA
jgi:hypothetical protein